jgi:hypothetical protein
VRASTARGGPACGARCRRAPVPSRRIPARFAPDSRRPGFGAQVIGMYHTLLGRDGFRKGMDLYFRRHDGAAVTGDERCAFYTWFTPGLHPTASARRRGRMRRTSATTKEVESGMHCHKGA